ncbi:MAG: hypothetical protein AAFV07_20775 [Bacteroidota bacterium]
MKCLRSVSAWNLLVYVCVLIFGTGCAKRFVVRQLKNNFDLRAEIKANPTPTDLGEFPGLKTLLQTNEVVNIWLLPGSRENDWTHFNNTISLLTDSLKFNITSFTEHPDIPAIPGTTPVGACNIYEWNFERTEDGGGVKKLNFFFTDWTAVNTPVKEKMYQYEDDNLDMAKPVEATFLSTKMKKGYMIDMVGGLPLYRQVDYHNQILRAAIKTLDRIHAKTNASDPTNTPLVAITGSMGTQLLLDTYEALIFDNDKLIDHHEQMTSLGNKAAVEQYVENFFHRTASRGDTVSLYCQAQMQEVIQFTLG